MFDDYLAAAITDGLLKDVTSAALSAGIHMPAAMTADAWADTVEWTQETQANKGNLDQTEASRLSSVMTSIHRVVARATGPTANVVVLRIPPGGSSRDERRTELLINIGPGRDNVPVMVISRPYENDTCGTC